MPPADDDVEGQEQEQDPRLAELFAIFGGQPPTSDPEKYIARGAPNLPGIPVIFRGITDEQFMEIERKKARAASPQLALDVQAREHLAWGIHSVDDKEFPASYDDRRKIIASWRQPAVDLLARMYADWWEEYQGMVEWVRTADPKDSGDPDGPSESSREPDADSNSD